MDKNVLLDPEVCEGCGDCGDQSGCLAIEPLETPLGRKRQINQSSCNKDLSCVRGFCPSFVTLDGDRPRRPQRGKAGDLTIPPLPDVETPGDFAPMAILVAGIGGTGVVTIGAVLTMAAHLDGKAGSSLDATGLSQKYEVARLYSRPAFMRSLRDGFDGDFKVSFHLAGGPFGKLDKVTGKIGKTAVGAWIRPAFRLLASARFLRGSRLDPFARGGAEALLNRRVLAAYEEDLDLLGHAAAQWPAERLRALLGWPASVRGYGHVRERAKAQASFAMRDRARDERGDANR